MCDEGLQTWQREQKEEKKSSWKEESKKKHKKQKSKKKSVKKDKRERRTRIFFQRHKSASSFFALSLSLEKIHHFERRLRTQRRLYEEDSLRRERE